MLTETVTLHDLSLAVCYCFFSRNLKIVECYNVQVTLNTDFIFL